MKTLELLFATVSVLVVFSTRAVASKVTVVGADDPAIDVQGVQDAVDNYDTVYLSGIFEFGSGGVVKIVKAKSESLSIIGIDNATIIGGGDGWKLTPSEGGTPGALTVHYGNRGNVAITNLTFQDTTFCAVFVAGGRTLEVSGCTVENLGIGGWPFGRGQIPIMVSESYSTLFNMPHSFTGETVLIENNSVELASEGGDHVQYGIAVLDFGLAGESYPDIIIHNNAILHEGQPAYQSIGIRLAGVQYPMTYVTSNAIENFSTAAIQAEPHFYPNMSGETYGEDNMITGSGEYGIALYNAWNNLFIIRRGQIESFNATGAHVYCGSYTQDNTFRFFGIEKDDVAITDQGTDNDMEFVEVVCTVDIDPDTLDLKGGGQWITCYLGLSEPYNVANISLASLRLERLLEVQQYDIQKDVLMAKFDKQDLATYITDVLGVTPPAHVELLVVGELTDGTRFEGSDTIHVN